MTIAEMNIACALSHIETLRQHGAVYEYTTEDHTCEGEVRLAAVSDERFEDNGHALAWAMAQ